MLPFIKKTSVYLYGHTLIRYFLFGGIATVIDMSMLYILTDVTGMWYFFSAMIAYAFGMITAFTLNRSFNFRNQSPQVYHTQFMRYAAIALAGLALNQAILWILVERAHTHYLAAKIVSVVLVSLASYAGHRVWTFAK